MVCESIMIMSLASVYGGKRDMIRWRDDMEVM